VQSTALITHTGTFGDQLDRACRATFALGFDRILVIGNDCPALTTAHLIEAANRLETAPVVLGPDRRGGIYLLGLSRAAFERISLIRLPWQTSQLAQAVRRLYADQPILLLPRLGDINGCIDLQQYGLTTTAAALFVAGLLALASGTSSARSGYPPLIRPGRVYLVGSSSLRAPPALYATGRAA
jgi:glycosyltransferase A (GT-A) superfamily protein (DUF2064 family)